MARRPNRSDPVEHKAQMAAANRARYRAQRDLIALHPQRFDELYAEECAKQVPPVIPVGRRNLTEEEQIVAEIERLQAQLDELEAEGDG